MQQAQQCFQHVQRGVTGAVGGRGIAAVERGLGQFQEPVAEFVPGKFVQRLRQQVETVAGVMRFGFGSDLVQAREDPFFGVGLHCGGASRCCKAFGVHQHEARGVPQLVAEVLVAFGATHVELDVAAVVGECGDGEAQCVGAVGDDAVREFLARGALDLLGHLRLHQAAGALGHKVVQRDAVDDVQRIQHVALGLGHFLPVLVADQAGDVDILERHLPGEVVGEHDHARDPEEDDVETGDQHAAGHVAVVAACLHRRVIRPAHRAERPQAGAEPGFQHVAILCERHIGAQRVLRACLGFIAAHIHVAVRIEPRRDAMTPPQLAADAPVLQVFHPVAISVDPVARHEAHVAVVGQLQAAFAQRVHLHEPLVGQVRLDHLAGAVAFGYLQLVRLGFDQQAFVFQVCKDLLAGFVAVEAAVLSRCRVVDRRGRGQDVDQWQVVALAHLVIVEVMRGRDLDHAGAEFTLDIGVGDDRNLALGQRQLHHLANQVRVALVFRMHGQCGITQHGFRARGGHDQVVACLAQRLIAVGIALYVFVAGTVSELVSDGPQETILLHVLHFQVGDRGLQHRVPVDQALAAIDQAFFVQAHEGFDHCLGGHRVHGEAAARPVARRAQTTHLLFDDVAGLRLPFPDFFDETVTAQRVAGFTLAFQRKVAAHHHLGGDAGVVGADLPQGVVTAHAVVTHKRVLQGVLEGVAHVQRTGDIRRRQQDGVRLALAGRLEVAGAFPLCVEAGFEGFGIVAGGEFGHGGAGKNESGMGIAGRSGQARVGAQRLADLLVGLVLAERIDRPDRGG